MKLNTDVAELLVPAAPPKITGAAGLLVATGVEPNPKGAAAVAAGCCATVATAAAAGFDPKFGKPVALGSSNGFADSAGTCFAV